MCLAASAAYAMSDGQYTANEQGCTNWGNAFDPQSADHDQNSPDGDRCQAYRTSVGTDNNEKLVRAGLDHEEPNENGFSGGHNPHHGTAFVGSPGEEVLILHYGTGIQHLPTEGPFTSPGGDGPYSDDHDQPELEAQQTSPENAEKIDDGAPSEVHFYNGADDNLESGEHDGISEGENGENRDLANGPSDGGAIRLDVAPDSESPENNVNTDDPATGPVRAAYAGIGACVDGICFTAGTGERQVYDGGQDDNPERLYLDNATADDFKDDGDECSYRNEDDCVRTIHDAQQDMYAHPGLTIYDDPDPQDSAIGFPGEEGTTHVGGGGIKIMGTDVVDFH
jgi:hypothetical protein